MPYYKCNINKPKIVDCEIYSRYPDIYGMLSPRIHLLVNFEKQRISASEKKQMKTELEEYARENLPQLKSGLISALESVCGDKSPTTEEISLLGLKGKNQKDIEKICKNKDKLIKKVQKMQKFKKNYSNTSLNTKSRIELINFTGSEENQEHMKSELASFFNREVWPTLKAAKYTGKKALFE